MRFYHYAIGLSDTLYEVGHCLDRRGNRRLASAFYYASNRVFHLADNIDRH